MSKGVLPDAPNGFRKISKILALVVKPLILLSPVTLHGVVFEIPVYGRASGGSEQRPIDLPDAGGLGIEAELRKHPRPSARPHSARGIHIAHQRLQRHG